MNEIRTAVRSLLEEAPVETIEEMMIWAVEQDDKEGKRITAGLSTVFMALMAQADGAEIQ